MTVAVIGFPAFRARYPSGIPAVRIAVRPGAGQPSLHAI